MNLYQPIYQHPLLLIQNEDDKQRVTTRVHMGSRLSQVAYLIASGLSNEEIAYEMAISLITTQNYIYNVRSHYGIDGSQSNRVRLAYSIIGEHNETTDIGIDPGLASDAGLAFVRESAQKLLTPSHSMPMNARTYEAAHLLSMGLTNEEIAREMVVALKTAMAYVRFMFAYYGIDADKSANRINLAYAIIADEVIRESRGLPQFRDRRYLARAGMVLREATRSLLMALPMYHNIGLI